MSRRLYVIWTIYKELAESCNKLFKNNYSHSSINNLFGVTASLYMSLSRNSRMEFTHNKVNDVIHERTDSLHRLVDTKHYFYIVLPCSCAHVERGVAGTS